MSLGLGLRLGLGTSLASGGGSGFNFFLFTVLFPFDEFFSWRTNGTPYVDISATAANYANSLDPNHYLYRAFEEWEYMVHTTDVSNGYVLGTLPVDSSELEGGGNWELSGTDAALYAINASTGQITVADAASLTAGIKSVTVTAPSGNTFAITMPVLDPATAGTTAAGSFRFYSSSDGSGTGTGTSVTDPYASRNEGSATPAEKSYYKRGDTFELSSTTRYLFGDAFAGSAQKQVFCYGDPSQPKPVIRPAAGWPASTGIMLVRSTGNAGDALGVGLHFDGNGICNNIWSEGSEDDMNFRHCKLSNNRISDPSNFIGFLMRNHKRVTFDFCEFTDIYGDNVYVNKSDDILFNWCTFNPVTGSGADAAQVVHEDNYSEVNRRIKFQYCAFGVDPASNKGALATEGVEFIDIIYCVSNAKQFGLNSAGWLVRNRYNYIYNSLEDKAESGILGATSYSHGNAIVSRNFVFDAVRGLQISGTDAQNATTYLNGGVGGWQRINQLQYFNTLYDCNIPLRYDQPHSGRAEYNIGIKTATRQLIGITNGNPGRIYYGGTDPQDGAVFRISGIASGMTEAEGLYVKVANRVNDNLTVINGQTISGYFDMVDTDGNPIDTTTWGTYTYPNGQLNWLIDLVPKGAANLNYESSLVGLASMSSDGDRVTINYNTPHGYTNNDRATFRFIDYPNTSGRYVINVLSSTSLRIDPSPLNTPPSGAMTGDVYEGNIVSMTSDGTSITINFGGHHDIWQPCNAYFKFGSYASSDGFWPITVVDNNTIRITPTTAPAAGTLTGTVTIKGEVDNRLISYRNNFHMESIDSFISFATQPTLSGTCQEGFDVTVSNLDGGTPYWLINGELIHPFNGDTTIAVPFDFVSRFTSVNDLACVVVKTDANGNIGIIDALWDDGLPIRNIALTTPDSFDSLVWYEGTANAGDDGTTFTWQDETSNNIDATNTVVAEWPSTAGVTNGISALTFDDDELNVGSGAYGYTNGAHTIVTLAQLPSSTANGLILNTSDGANARSQIFFPISGEIWYRFGQSTPKNAVISWTPDNDPHILTATYNGTSSFTIQLDDGTPGVQNVESPFTATSVIIGDNNGSRPPTNIGFFAIFSKVLSADELKAVKRYAWAAYELQKLKVYRDVRDYNFNARIQWAAIDYYVDNWADKISGIELQTIGDPTFAPSGWTLDGNDGFKSTALITDPVVRDIHKTTGGQPATIVLSLKTPDVWAGTQYFLSNIDFSTGNSGFDVRVNASGVVTFVQAIAATNDTVTLGTLLPDTNYEIAIAVDTVNGNIKYAFNADAFTDASAGYSPVTTTTDPDEVLRIGANAAETNFLGNGAVIRLVSVIEGYLSDAEWATLRSGIKNMVY